MFHIGSLPTVLLSAALLVVPAAGVAGDVPVGHPWRKQILDAARPTLLYDRNQRFRVVKLWASESRAFLCAFIQDENGGLSRTDDYLDMTMAILARKSGQWVILASVENLVPSMDKAECLPGIPLFTTELSDEILERALLAPPFAEGRKNR